MVHREIFLACDKFVNSDFWAHSHNTDFRVHELIISVSIINISLFFYPSILVDRFGLLRGGLAIFSRSIFHQLCRWEGASAYVYTAFILHEILIIVVVYDAYICRFELLNILFSGFLNVIHYFLRNRLNFTVCWVSIFCECILVFHSWTRLRSLLGWHRRVDTI